MSKWLFNFIVDKFNAKRPMVIEIHIGIGGGLSNVLVKESFKQPNGAEAMSLV